MLDVEHDSVNKQFTLFVEGKPCTLKYHVLPGREVLNYYSTYVPPELRGRQLGDVLVKHALDYAKEHQLMIIASCPFVQRYIDHHPDYQSLVFHEIP